MIKHLDLCKKAETPLNQRWGYIWGSAGERWTSTKQKALEKKYYSNPEQYKNYKQGAIQGSKWIDHIVSDCSGLFVWLYSQFGYTIPHGSNSIWNQCKVKGRIEKGQQYKPGTALFLTDGTNRHHIAIWTGEKVIEARSTYYGVTDKRKLDDFDEWAELPNIDYGGVVMYPTLRKGDKNESVKTLQSVLRLLGYQIAPDGAFGSETETTVKAFQKREGLQADGIAGSKTWKAIENELGYNPFTNKGQDERTDKINTYLDAMQNEIDMIRQLL